MKVLTPQWSATYDASAKRWESADGVIARYLNTYCVPESGDASEAEMLARNEFPSLPITVENDAPVPSETPEE